jgi:hypothetical protein
MKAGNFNIHEYLERLNENEEAKNGNLPDNEGMIIPDENKKSYDWLKKEYQKGKTEVKVEISQGGAKFEPKYDMQASNDSDKSLKPDTFGEVKTANQDKPKEDNTGLTTQDAKSSKDDGELKKEKMPKTNSSSKDINNKEEKEEKEDTEDKEEKEDTEDKEEKEEDKNNIKKVDLKTKKA